ncbi:YopX family protein [Polaribacter sp. IC073]|uniref:YopX family protein n=1 Tax=Polaribacter sp. IC073 TaxID=2508540 RepID=UPI0011BE3081|nr:YopX family protein [Polaribacter sp. IC073]TXD45893.1 hypothetical protein ES045_15830 [Polaribacter sp. IC073]
MKKREHKFRFWDKDLKKMCNRKPSHNDFSHAKIIPLEYTGFKDCNGIEVYEGYTLIDVEENLKDTQQQVYWCSKLGCWKLDQTFTQNKESGYLLANELKDFKFQVVGNIYENSIK